MGSPAPAFHLPGTDGREYSLESFKDRKALLIVFMCNHCPYVIAVHERLSQIARDYGQRDLAVIGINSNDPLYKEADSFENMKKISRQWNLPFPYVMDESQNVARAYDAVCTPDPYLYENVAFQGASEPDFRLRYRGRIDDSWQDESKVKEQSLRLAIEAVLVGKNPITNQVPSMGCSIKWKELTVRKS